MNKPIYFSKPEPFIGAMGGLITVPSDFDPKKESLPLILFLHGAGESGNGTEQSVQKVCRHGIAKYFSADPDYGNLRVITASPQCPDGLIWDQVTLQLLDWLQSVIEQYHVDTKRMSITGLSMGGFGTWNMITTYPDLFRKAAPICGGGVPWRVDERMRKIQIRTYHSIDDPSVPYNCTVEMVSRAREHDINVSFTTYTDKGHGCWSAAYEEGDLIPWLCGE